MSSVQERFDLVAVPCEKLLLLVPGERAFGRARLFEDKLTLVLEPGDFVGRQGIREPEGNEINRALFFQVRKPATKMQTGNQGVWRCGIRRRVVRVGHGEKVCICRQTGKSGFAQASQRHPRL